METKKVLVGCPIYDGKEYCLKEYIEGLKSLTFENFDVCLVDTSKKGDFFKKLLEIASDWEKEKKGKFSVKRIPYISPEPRQRIIEARNMIREIALKENYDYFFSLEADVIAPSDMIERLLLREKEIVSGVYFNLVPQRNSLVILAFEKTGENEHGEVETRTLTLQDIMPSRLIENLYVTGVGCILIKRNVLAKIKFRFDEKFDAFDDWWFCTDAIKEGFSINLDTSMLCKHYYKPWREFK